MVTFIDFLFHFSYNYRISTAMLKYERKEGITMRLNPDCIRAILLTVEENCDFDTPWQYVAEKHNSEYLSTFTHPMLWLLRLHHIP